jgi:UDP-N-acetylmuramate dehydrogenase
VDDLTNTNFAEAPSNKAYITEHESLAAFCTYRTGGRARYFARPADVKELKDVLVWADAMKLPHEVIGFGANLLIADEGYPGLIICLRKFERWCVRKENTIYAGAGTLLGEVVNYAAAERLCGLENLVGIPGTVGGAIKMNAGAYGTEIKDVVTRVTVLENTENGLSERLIEASEAGFGYRHASGLLGKIILAAEFSLNPTDADLRAVMTQITRARTDKQPLDMPSCGSVFKRPVGSYAGSLIEQTGLKGAMVGGAKVSDKHANFIVNTGEATSWDIYMLIQYVKRKVFEKTGIMLEEEVRYLGFKTDV